MKRGRNDITYLGILSAAPTKAADACRAKVAAQQRRRLIRLPRCTIEI
jgi:hypothetical protein